MAEHGTAIETVNTSGKPVMINNKIVHRSPWRDAVNRFGRNRLAMVGLVIILFLAFLAIFADVITPYPYDKADFTVARQLPFVNPAHILGADYVGRDYLARL